MKKIWLLYRKSSNFVQRQDGDRQIEIWGSIILSTEKLSKPVEVIFRKIFGLTFQRILISKKFSTNFEVAKHTVFMSSDIWVTWIIQSFITWGYIGHTFTYFMTEMHEMWNLLILG